jgi:hypothetical protein
MSFCQLFAVFPAKRVISKPYDGQSAQTYFDPRTIRHLRQIIFGRWAKQSATPSPRFADTGRNTVQGVAIHLQLNDKNQINPRPVKMFGFELFNITLNFSIPFPLP